MRKNTYDIENGILDKNFLKSLPSLTALAYVLDWKQRFSIDSLLCAFVRRSNLYESAYFVTRYDTVK